MRTYRFRPFIVCTLLAVCLLITGCTERVKFSDGRIKIDSQEISLALEEGEAALLDSLPNLSYADLSGSSCYEEICLWAEEHPDVEVYYTVSLPDGTVADTKTESLDFSELSPELFKATAEMLRYLPNLRTVELGEGSRSLSVKELLDISSTRKDVRFLADVKIDGRSISTGIESLDFAGKDMSALINLRRILPAMYNLKTVELGSSEESPLIGWGDISALQNARPDVNFEYHFTLYDREFSTTDTEIDLNHIRVYDKGASLREAMHYMPNLVYLDMDSCGVSDEDMASIRDEFPNVKVVWRIWFGGCYSVRTDVERILASKPTVGGELEPYNTKSLKYCTDVKHLDLGHNELMTSIDFVEYMPDLEVAILSISGWADASPLANCTKLEYLEIQTTDVCDLTPLANLTELKHLNICYLFNLTDITPLYGLTKLERLWIGCLSPVPQEQIDKMQEIVPDCEINTTTYDPTAGGWRYLLDENGNTVLAPRYKLLREQFGEYSLSAYAFFWFDPKY